MPSLVTIQRLFVISAVVWAITPRWGGFAFAACWALLAIGSSRRTSEARRLLEGATGTVLATLPPEAVEHARRYPLAYVWPASATGWGTTWQLGALLSLLLCVVFGAWALFTLSAWYLLLLLPLVAAVVAGGAMSRRIKIDERVKDDLTALRVTHQTLTTLLSLKKTMGQWPPAPSPDPESKKS